MVTISGQATYDFVPTTQFNGLNYAATDSTRPLRLATVQFVDGNTVLAATRTTQTGDYSLAVDQNQSGFIRIRAESVETGSPSWSFRVVDNTSADAIYTLDGAVASSGTADSQRNLHAPSGWTGAGYGDPRAAAPFAILDTILIGGEYVATADPTIDFPALDIHWSENNMPALDANGNVDLVSGEIGTSQYISSEGLFLLGAEDSDTEEYDRHVVLHEFGHYLEFRLTRSDSIGGPHALGDRVDMRVAFSEGWATALAGLALSNPFYADTQGALQASGFGFNMESRGNNAPGWYSEQSVQEIIYDLVDLNFDGNDIFTYSFATVWSAIIGPLASTPALTSIFPFLNAIKTANSGDEAALDQLAADQSIDSVSTDFGGGETNNAGDNNDVLPIYADLVVNNPVPVNLCSIDSFSSGITGSTNKLSSRRFVRFMPPVAGNVTITMTATTIPNPEYADPDFIIHRQGPFAISENPPSDACTNTGDAGWTESNCVESAITTLPAQEHILEVYEWSNTNAADDPLRPPIGRTCFDVTVTQP